MLDLALYLILYSFLGWAVEVGYYAVTNRRFHNRGFLTLPLLLSYGATFDLLILVLPTLGNRRGLQFLFTMVAASVVESLFTQMKQRIGPKLQWETERSRLFSGKKWGVLLSAAVAMGYYFTYLLIHPLLLGLMLLIPKLVKQIVVWGLLILLVMDFAAVFYALRFGDAGYFHRRMEQGKQDSIAGWIFNAIWRRLQKAYPGIREMDEEEQETYTFAKGLCFDKLIWVFLISALLGYVIETFYCGLVDGEWMNRSSVLYGPFSFVWGLGAVVLTVTLQRLAEKHDRSVFLAGFVIGGAYEYLCSVFTELVFGTVFWDYSDMPLNIGGRTNVLFCCFWGALAVIWVKILYPRMAVGIERVPVLPGKVLTWAMVFVMACNSVLTSAAMLRYDLRADNPEPANGFEVFLDQQYGDEFMENRWPNMIVTERTE